MAGMRLAIIWRGCTHGWLILSSAEYPARISDPPTR